MLIVECFEAEEKSMQHMLSGTCLLEQNLCVLINRKHDEASGCADNPRNRFCIGYCFKSLSGDMQKIKEDFPKKEKQRAKVLFILRRQTSMVASTCINFNGYCISMTAVFVYEDFLRLNLLDAFRS